MAAQKVISPNGSKYVDDYLKSFPVETQKKLQELRHVIHSAAPASQETLSYGIPTVDLKGKHLIHFAGYRNHLGLYPGAKAIEAFQGDIVAYKNAKGSVQFPLEKPLPVELVKRIVQFRCDEVGEPNEEKRPVKKSAPTKVKSKRARQ
jgi:uncharacterized protein YdhG (YjbR/CyaY superfamily)